MAHLSDEIVGSIADSLVQVYAWNRNVLQLTVLVEKPEAGVTGTLTFLGVQHFCLPAETKVSRIEECSAGELPDRFWESVSVSREHYEVGQPFFIFFDLTGERYFVVADSVVFQTET